ncbi:hypothetical protein JZ751_011108 [Albula glossodonta]|uniref:Transforming acidic coiled-coil-containing protein C-terminal domain-containing protein n=1 Tax=Albula glossodonta TaxID=121402 RepID=A0A8T2P4C8_9TELE|nr:hypothetical protein JZ751_011108 [Albula glossodonta]
MSSGWSGVSARTSSSLTLHARHPPSSLPFFTAREREKGREGSSGRETEAASVLGSGLEPRSASGASQWRRREEGVGVRVVVGTMAVSAWQALSPLQWARWGWDTLLGGSGTDPALGLLQRLTWGARHDNMLQAGRGSAKQRSSDSDGAFETPESTTPVKAAPPPLPPPEPNTETQPPPSEDTGFCSDSTSVPEVSLSEPVSESPSFRPPCRSFSTVFDEDKPIASSGTYNLDLIAAASAADTFPSGQTDQPLSPDSSAGRRRSPLTRSLSLQAGDLDSSPQEGGTAGGAADRPSHPQAEAFSVGTESAPGTLRKTKKPRPASLKKRPLTRQSSNPPGTAEGSTISTPELGKKGREEEEEGSAGPSPKGSLRKTKASPKPPSILPDPQDSVSVKEDNKHPAQPASPTLRREPSPPASTTALPPVPDEDSPIPPKASYNWDPENFEGIDPFRTGGSKVANSPVLGRKGVTFNPTVEPVGGPTEEPVPTPAPGPGANTEEQPLNRRQSVRLEFDYSEESSEAPRDATPPPKKLGKKPGAKMPLRKPKLGVKKVQPPPVEQLDNAPPPNNEDIPIPKASYNFDPNKWDDPNFNPFCPGGGIPNSPRLSRPAYSFDPDNFDDSVDPFKPSTKTMGNSPPKASPAAFEVPANDNDSLSELEDQNQNKPAKKKKTPIKSMFSDASLCCLFNTFRVKKSPKRSPMSEAVSQEPTPLDSPDAPQDDHATDEEKLASSSNQKWAALQGVEAELTSDPQDLPQPSDLTAFVNENSLPTQPHVTPDPGEIPGPCPDYEIEYMEKIGSSTPTPPQDPADPADTPLLDRLSESGGPLQYLEPDLAETNPTAFAQKLQEELVLAALRIEALQILSMSHSNLACPLLAFGSPVCDPHPSHVPPPHPLHLISIVLSHAPQSRLKKPTPRRWNINGSQTAKGPLYSMSGYSEGGGSSYLPRDLDHSLGIAREEIVAKEQEVADWQRKYEESRQEVVEMRRIVAEYEKTIAQMIEDEQREKSLSHHTIQQLILEKDQALADLNSVEKSLADLFRRYEKMKDVLEGFRKNEEVLKKCAQEYLSRVRKEEQRYQALKIHAEEKLDKANADIAQVRAKAKQEQAAYQASLRKEQMKNKEIEELTKICDELISKMGKS